MQGGYYSLGSRPIRKLLSSEWIRGVKGYFVCAKDHRENNRHIRDKVNTAIKSLLSKHSQALVSVEDLAGVVDVAVLTDDVNRSSEDDVQVAKEAHEEEFYDIVYLSHDDKSDPEVS